jgi:hypothetical protein
MQRRAFHIENSTQPRPSARGVIYCDGGTDDRFREGVDLQLSHWIPNQTPREVKADTSSDLVINNHACRITSSAR